MSKIEIKDLTLTYKNRFRKPGATALNHFSVTFDNAKIHMIMGESGGGKTSLLRAIMGLEDYSGLIICNGVDFSTLEPSQRDLSYISQDIVLYPQYNIFNNIAFPLTTRDVPKDEIRERVFDIAGDFHITELLFRKPRELSLGQAQRAALARAIIKRPKIYILDEPFSNLDEKNALEIGHIMKDYFKTLGATVIYVTHNPKEALMFGDTITIIERGRLLINGNANDVYQSNKEEVRKYFKGL